MLYNYKKKFHIKRMIFLTAILIFGLTYTQCNIVLKPIKASSNEACLILVQGAEIPAINYKLHVLKLQEKFNGSLWIGLTEFPLNTPEPLLINSIMDSLFKQLLAEGFHYTKNTPFFFAGHSLGGIMLQDYIFKATDLPFKLSGVILLGSFITRNNLNKKATFPVLTLGAELDGLARITRIAVSYYFDSLFYPNRMTLIIEGMDHYQFAGEGSIPGHVKKYDIEPEITNDEARDASSSIIVSFVHKQLNMQSNQDIHILKIHSQTTNNLAEPIIQALQMEGFYHFASPCSQTSKKNSSNCTIGSPWTKVAQSIMGPIGSANLIVNDEFHKIFQIPEHFPSINNKCTFKEKCILNVTTVTSNEYSATDSLDTGNHFSLKISKVKKKEEKQ
jgi:hypothetical protein